MIVLYSSRFFMDDVFFHLYLLALIYVYPIRYVFDWYNHVSDEHQLYWTLVLIYMIRRLYSKGCCR